MANRFKKEKENKEYLKFGNKYKKENNFSPYTPGIVYDNNNNSEVENTENVDEETKKQQIIDQVTEYALKNGYTQEQVDEYLASQGLIEPKEKDKGNWLQRLSSTGDDLQYAIQKGVLKGLEGTLDTAVGFGSQIATGVANLFDSHENKKGGLIGQEITGKETVGDKITKWADKFISKDLTGNYMNTNVQAYLNEPLETGINAIQGEYKNLSDYQKTLEQSYLSEGKVGGMIRGGAESIGQMLPSIIVNKAGAAQILGTAVFGFGAAGNATEQALQQGANLNDAVHYGAAIGMLESAVEGISGNIGGFGTNVFQRILSKGSGKVASKLATSTVFKLATNSISEGLEEVASEIATPYLDRYILNIDTPDATAEQCLEAGIMGASIGLLMSGASLTNRQQVYLSNLEDLYSMHQNAVNSKNYEGANYIWESIEIEQGKASKYFTQEELSFSNIKHKMNVLDKLETREDFAQNSEYIGQLYESISKDLKGLDETTRKEILSKTSLGFDFNEQGNVNQQYKDLGREKNLELRNVVKNAQRIDPSVNISLEYSDEFNGNYDAATNTLTLAVNNSKNANAVALHEFLHKVRPTSQYKQISELATEIAKKQGKYDQKINKLKEKYEKYFSESSEAKNLLQKLNNNEISSQEYEKQYDEALTEYVQEEFVADYIGDTVFAGNQKAINELVGENESLAKKILNLFNKKTQESDKLTAEEKKYYNKIKKSFKAAIEESKAKQNPLTINEDGMTKYNIKTFESGGSEMLEKELKKKKFSKEEIEDVMATMNRMVAITKTLMKKYPIVFNSQNMEITTDENGNTYVSAWEKNGEYKYNIDLTTICKKRETFSDVLDYLISNEDFNNLNFSQENLVELNLLLQQEGIETACPLCFVDAKRYRIDSWATDITTKWNELCEKSDTELQKIIDEHNELQRQKEEKAKQEGKEVKKAKTPPYIKCCIEMIKNPELKKKINKEDLMGSNIKEFLRVNKNDVLEYYVFNAYGSGTPKPIKKYSPYNNEILDRKKTSPVIKRTTDKNGGVRLFSFSDFKVEDFFDYVQIFSNLAAKKLKLQSYAKEISYAKIFGLTGAKINLSLIPKVMKIYNEDGSVNIEKTKENAGLDKNGNFIYDESHSVDIKEAFALCKKDGYRGNVGTILVGVSDKQIIKALRDNRISMIIPYHKSNLNPVVASLYGIDTYTDYTLSQRTRETKSNGKIAAISVNKEFEFYKDLEITQDPRTTASNYLKWCEANNYQPKFPQFIKEKNYYKLLVDFNVYDGDVYVPQQEVKLEFPKNVNKIIESYVSQRQSQINERNEKIDSIQKRALEILKRPSTDKKFSLKDNQGTKLTNEQAEFFKDVDPKLLDKKGRLMRFYHGTQALNLIEEAGIFLASKAYSGPMAFFTGSIDLAESYAKNKKIENDNYENNFIIKDSKNLLDYYLNLPPIIRSKLNEKVQKITVTKKDSDFVIKNTIKKQNQTLYSFLNSRFFRENPNAINKVLDYLGLSNEIKFDQSKASPVKQGVFESYLNITNGLWTETKDKDNKSKLENLLEKMKEFQSKNVFSTEMMNIFQNSKYLKQINKTFFTYNEMNEMEKWIGNFEQDLKNNTKKVWVDIPPIVTVFLETQGYDGIIDESGKFSKDPKAKNHLVAIPFYEEQVKSVDNLNPTNDRRFRYSLKEDSRGKELSSKQIEKFGDLAPDMYDDNGNLKRLYHGTDNAGFDTFAPTQNEPHYHFGENFVTFLTDFYGMAASYGDGQSVKPVSYTSLETTDKNAVYEVYAEIKKPFVIDSENSNWDNIKNPFYDKNNLDKNKKIYEKFIDLKVSMVNYSMKNYKSLFNYLKRKKIKYKYQELLPQRIEEDLEQYESLKGMMVTVEIDGFEFPFEATVKEQADGRKIYRPFNFKDWGGGIKERLNLTTTTTTNELIYNVIRLNKQGSDFDGVIIKNIYDYGQNIKKQYQKPANLYITIKNPNQIKSIYNTNPTSSDKLKYSLKDQDVSKTKPVSPEYVTGYADANQQWKYTKKSTTQIYNDMMNSILIPSDKVKVKGGKGKILDYLFQQINKDKVATSEIADKIVDYVFDNVTVNDQNIPESFKSALKKQFKNDLYETVFNGGKATFKTKMIERIDALKEKIEVMKQKDALKSALKNFKKIKKLEKANFSYNPQAQNVATVLNTALNYFTPTTNKLSEIFAQIQNPATRKNVESFIKIVEKYNSDPNSLNKIDIPVATLDEVKKLYDIDRMGEELNSKELLAYSHLLSAINHIVNQYINSKNALSYSVAANKAQIIKQDLDSKEQVNVTKLTSIPAAIIKMPIRIKYFEGSSTGESFGLTNYVVKELQQAEIKKMENIMYLKEEFDDFFKKNKKFLKRLSSETVNINGQDLTLAQAISLYELSKRPTASRHFVLDEEPNALGINVYDKNKNLKGTLLFQENPTDIIEQKFDSTTMEYIDIVERMFNEKAKQLKIDTDNEYLGYTNVTQDLYFPSTVDKKGRPKSIAKASMAKEIEELYGQSYNQNTTEKATNKLELKPVDFVVADHIERVSSYNAFMVPVTKIDRMMNTVLDKKEGPLHSIITSKQSNFYDAIHAWVVDTVQSKQFDTESKLVNFFLSTYATSTLGFNIKTGFTQLMAYPLAFKFINIKNLGKGIANKKFTKQDYAQMDKYCPYVRYRNYSSDVVTQEVGAKALGTIQDIAMAHITFTDRFTIERLWIASQYQIESELGYKVGTEENLTEAGKLLETIIRDTQAVNTLEQPTVQRRAGTFSKIVLMFTKQATQMFNSLTGSILEYRVAKQRLKANPTDAKLQALEKTSRKQMLNTITGVSASILGETLLTMAAAALLGKDDDDEKKLETFLKEMLGNTAGMIPFINQLSGLIQGYDFNISVTQSINNLASALKSVGTYIEKNDFRGAWYQWSKAIAPFTGIPFKNINEYGLTIIGAFSPETAYKFRSIWYNKTIAKYTEDVYKYVEKGDEEMVGTIFLEIYKEKGITIDSDDIESELIALANSGIDVTKIYPKATNRVFTVEGEEYKLTLNEYKDFQKAYSKYLTENVENLIYTGKYINLDSETQAKAIKYIQDAAYYRALQEIKPDIDSFTISKTNMLSKAVDVKYVSTVLAYGNSISGDDKKVNIQKYINSLKISKTEKEILFAMFYKPDKSRTSTISNYLSSKGYTSSEVRIILKKLKYIEEEK